MIFEWASQFCAWITSHCFFVLSRCSWESWLCYSCDLIIFFLSQHGDSGLFIHLKVQSSCLKFSTYSFIYRDCGLLQNEKVRDVHSAVTQSRQTFPIPNPICEPWQKRPHCTVCSWIWLCGWLTSLFCCCFILFLSSFFSGWLVMQYNTLEHNPTLKSISSPKNCHLFISDVVPNIHVFLSSVEQNKKI